MLRARLTVLILLLCAAGIAAGVLMIGLFSPSAKSV